jgi:CPA1 family monovalent cation:H+ antiporter
MTLLLAIGLLLGLTAAFGVINERYLHLPSAIGLMLLALAMTIILVKTATFTMGKECSWVTDGMTRVTLNH